MAAHNLYVKVAPESREVTLAVLRYVHSNLPALRRMGLSIRVHEVSAASLGREELRRAFAARGVTGLPALVTAEKTYVGLASIVEVYGRNLRAFAERPARAAGGAEAADGDDGGLAAFYGGEMSFDRAAEADDDEEAVGEGGGGMLDAYHRAAAEREARGAARRPGARGGAAPAPAPPPSRRPAPPPSRRPAPAPSPPPRPGRPDNVAPPGDADDFRATLDSLARDIDDGLRTRAFEGGGSYDDEGEGDNPQDRLMERAYYANLQATET